MYSHVGSSLNCRSSYDKTKDITQELLQIVYGNILPEYRKAMRDKLVDSLDDLERYGQRCEKQCDLDSRYVPQLLAKKIRVPGTAYSGGAVKLKVSAAEEVEKETTGTPKSKKAKKAQAKIDFVVGIGI